MANWRTLGGSRSPWGLWIGTVAVALALAAVGAAVAVSMAPEPVDPRAGITCMDDAGGGVYCWKAKP
jgi:hypothetical protein